MLADPCPLCGRTTEVEVLTEETEIMTEHVLLTGLSVPVEFWIGVGVGLVLAFIAVLVGFAASL